MVKLELTGVKCCGLSLAPSPHPMGGVASAMGAVAACIWKVGWLGDMRAPGPTGEVCVGESWVIGGA